MKNKTLRLILTALVLALAFALIYFGVDRGEARMVLSKAAGLCFQCIGLGE